MYANRVARLPQSNAITLSCATEGPRLVTAGAAEHALKGWVQTWIFASSIRTFELQSYKVRKNESDGLRKGKNDVRTF